MTVLLTPTNITTDLMEHADGRPIAYTDATAVAVFVYQGPTGTWVIDICTRTPAADHRIRVLLDNHPLLREDPQP